MMQCSDCEYFHRDALGNAKFACNPFINIKESECLTKWQLIKLDAMTQKVETMVQAYQATLAIYRKLAPMQEKMFRHMEREIDEIDESEQWKLGYEDEDDEEEEPLDNY